MQNLGQLLAPYVAQVDREMRRLMPSLDERDRSYFGQMHYHLGWANAAYEAEENPTGKRVRAALCLMACEALSGSTDRALSAAVAIEFLHEFTLIHDDIQDEDRLRRHRPTLWTLVGAPQAINAGDGLYALGQRALLFSRTRGVPADTVLRAHLRFNEATVFLCVGQHYDMEFEQRDSVTPDEYMAMIRGKTAALLAFAGEAGALMAGGDEQSIAAFREMGEAIGIAFQMKDDLLGLWGDPATTGKAVGADIRAKKKSMPIAYALSQPESEALRALYAGPLDDEAQIAEVTRLVTETGAQEYVVGLIQQQEQRIFKMLERVNATPDALLPVRTLIELLTYRDY